MRYRRISRQNNRHCIYLLRQAVRERLYRMRKMGNIFELSLSIVTSGRERIAEFEIRIKLENFERKRYEFEWVIHTFELSLLLESVADFD